MERLARGPGDRRRKRNLRARARDLPREYGGSYVSWPSATIPVIFGTQVSNLRDLPPFVSRHRPDFLADQLQAFDAAIESRTREASETADHEAALSAFPEALSSIRHTPASTSKSPAPWIHSGELTRLSFTTSALATLTVSVQGQQRLQRRDPAMQRAHRECLSPRSSEVS